MIHLPTRSFLHGLLKRIPSKIIKSAIWNHEFRGGSWDYLEAAMQNGMMDPIIDWINRFLKSGDILECGCGTGKTLAQLDSKRYSAYIGIDISAVAICKAREKTALQEKEHTFVVSSMEDYIPVGAYSVILFRESLYYVQVHNILPMLFKYREHLDPCGVIIARFCDRVRFMNIIEMITSHFNVIENQQYDNTIILVFS
jgi:SAM-dependent methyltransferase